MTGEKIEKGKTKDVSEPLPASQPTIIHNAEVFSSAFLLASMLWASAACCLFHVQRYFQTTGFFPHVLRVCKFARFRWAIIIAKNNSGSSTSTTALSTPSWRAGRKRYTRTEHTKRNNTRAANAVPHCSTSLAQRHLTSQSGRDVVQSIVWLFLLHTGDFHASMTRLRQFADRCLLVDVPREK